MNSQLEQQELESRLVQYLNTDEGLWRILHDAGIAVDEPVIVKIQQGEKTFRSDLDPRWCECGDKWIPCSQAIHCPQ